MVVSGVELLDFGPGFKPEGGRLTFRSLLQYLDRDRGSSSRGHGYRLNSVPLDN